MFLRLGLMLLLSKGALFVSGAVAPVISATAPLLYFGTNAILGVVHLLSVIAMGILQILIMKFSDAMNVPEFRFIAETQD